MNGPEHTPSHPSEEAPPDQTLKEVGGFQLIVKIGQGAMGAVFKARQKSLDREVALKILPPSIAKDKVFIERFVREARASAKLTHPNIVSGIDVGQDGPTRLWYFAMEYVDGPTVKQSIKEQGRIDEDKALEIARDVARALECAHENKMVHRDVKPDNILLNSSGTAKLADLGLARQTSGSEGSPTRFGNALGTPNYMSPEQIRGEIDSLDTRTDLYALGATLFHMVTGQVPFTGESSAVIMARHLSDPPPLANRINPNVSQGCSRLIQRLMQKERTDRFQDPTEVIEQIERMLKLPPAARGLATGPRSATRPKSTTGPRQAVRGTSGPRAPVRGATTSAREIVQGRSDGIRKTTANPMALTMGIAAGVAVVVIIGLAMAFTGGRPAGPPDQRTSAGAGGTSGSERPTPTSNPANVSPSPTAPTAEEQLATKWAAARAFAAENPEEYAGILHRYRAVGEAAGGSPLAAEVRAATSKVEQAWDAAAQKAWADLDARITAAADAGDYDTALATARQLPEAHAARMKDTLAERCQTLETGATEKIRLALEQAEAASSEAKPAEGLKALAAVAHIKYADAAVRIQQIRERLEREVADVAELAERRGVLEQRKKLDGFLDRFDVALLEGDDVSMAESVAREAARGDWPEGLKVSVEAMGVLLKAYGELRDRRAARLDALKGQEVTLKEGKGVIEKIEDGTLHVTLSLQGGKVTATKRVTLADLPAAERTRLLPPMQFDSDAARVAAALGDLSKGREDFPAAGAALAQAPAFPLTSHYQDLLRRRQLGATERAAEQAWRDLSEAALVPLNKANAGKLYERFLTFRDEHGATAFVKEHAAEIEASRARVAAVARPSCIANGDFESGDTKGWTLSAFKDMGDPVAGVTAEAGHGGGRGLCFKTSGRLQQTVSLEPGQPYHFSCWVRNAGAYLRVGIVGAPKGAGARTGGRRDFAEWTQLAFPFTATQNEHVVEVMVYSKKPVLACFDEIQLLSGRGAAAAAGASKAPPDAIRFQGSAYKAFERSMLWEEARDFCEQQGGCLLCIESREENDFIASKLLRERMWLGASIAGDSWEWVNGAPYEPVVQVEATRSRGEDYLSIQAERGWRDTPRTTKLPFICEWDAPVGSPGVGETAMTTPVAPVAPVAPLPDEPAKAEPLVPGKAEPLVPAKVVPAAAQFLSENLKLRGNWKGTYGSEGYAICGGATKLPDYAKLTIGGTLYQYEREQARGDTRGLLHPDGNTRICAANYVATRAGPLEIKLGLTDGGTHPVTFYMADYRRPTGTCKVDIVDPQSGRVLASRVARYSNGAYLTFTIAGTVTIKIGPDDSAPPSRREGAQQDYVHISGVFFK